MQHNVAKAQLYSSCVDLVQILCSPDIWSEIGVVTVASLNKGKIISIGVVTSAGIRKQAAGTKHQQQVDPVSFYSLFHPGIKALMRSIYFMEKYRRDQMFASGTSVQPNQRKFVFRTYSIFFMFDMMFTETAQSYKIQLQLENC